jgi:hypothetical protein
MREMRNVWNLQNLVEEIEGNRQDIDAYGRIILKRIFMEFDMLYWIHLVQDRVHSFMNARKNFPVP